ncbi:TetR/AcrR family transcriptional regulator, partial [Escherichia coli]|uniref:TetR/AcrR family transcriptional regulator n=1 Tax=Escherichia coli TaxID=562 RepID=UPI003D360456
MTGENRGRVRPRKTEITYADTRNDLIRSGLELRTQNGPRATGVDAIVKNANVPKGA